MAPRGDPLAKAKAYAEKYQLTYPVLVDAKEEMFARIGWGVPKNIVVGKDGRVKFVHVGDYREGRERLLERIIEAIEAARKAR